MKAIIHLHPQNAYLFKCLWHIQTVKRVPLSEVELILLPGPCFLFSIMEDYKEFLRSTSNRLLGKVKSLEIVSVPSDLFQWTTDSKQCPSFPAAEHPDLTLEWRELWEHSIYDSLYRNIWHNFSVGDFYTSLETDRKSADELIAKRKFLALKLYSFYQRTLILRAPLHAYVSHQSYDFYLTFIAAAKSLDIPMTFVHGGHQIMFDIKKCSGYGIGKDCPIKEIGQSPQSFKMLFSNITKNNESGSPDSRIASTPYSKSAIQVLSDRQTSGVKRGIFVILPIFSEIQIEIHNCMNIFKSRREWFYYTLESLPDSADIPCVIRVHPNSSDYNELGMTLKWISFVRSCRRNPLYVCTTQDDFRNAIEQLSLSVVDSKWLLFQGSLSLELPTLGIKPMSAVCPVSPLQTHLQPLSLAEYNYRIKNFEKDQPLDSESAAWCKQLLNLDNLLTKGTSASSVFMAADDTYHFGNRRVMEVSQFRKLLDISNQILDYKLIPTKSFDVYLFSGKSHGGKP